MKFDETYAHSSPSFIPAMCYKQELDGLGLQGNSLSYRIQIYIASQSETWPLALTLYRSALCTASSHMKPTHEVPAHDVNLQDGLNKESVKHHLFAHVQEHLYFLYGTWSCSTSIWRMGLFALLAGMYAKQSSC